MSEHEREQQVLAEAHRLIRDFSAGAEQFDLLQEALADFGRKRVGPSGERVLIRAIHVPLLVHAAVAGEEGPAVPLAAACLLLYAGIDLLDDVMDGDLAPEWRRFHRAEPLLAAFTLVAALTHLVVVSLETAGERRVAMVRALARSGLLMSRGQQQDLRFSRSPQVTLAEAEASVIGKSGDFGALLATLAAQLAGASDEQIDHYAEFGRSLAIAAQIRSDLADLFGLPPSRDLSHGTRTVPVALALDRLHGQEREQLSALLERATHMPEVHPEIQRLLLSLGVSASCALIVEYYCAEARAALNQAAPLPPARDALDALIARCTLLDAK